MQERVPSQRFALCDHRDGASVDDAIVNIGRRAQRTVNGRDVLWAARKHYDQIYFGAQDDAIAWLGGGWKALDLALGPDLHVHEQIEWGRSLAAIDSHRGKGLPEVVAAITMILFATQFDVDRLVAGAQQHVVTAGRSIADKGEHWSPSIAVEHIAGASERVLASRYIKRDLHPQDLLGALVFLASADSDFMSGQNVLVDGGNANT